MGLLADLFKVSHIEVGKAAPDFTLTTEKGEEWRLSDQRGQVTALLFYPGNETLVCTRQMCALRNNWAEYLETKASIVGISPGSIEENERFSLHHKLPLPLLADNNRKITNLYSYHWLMPVQLRRAIVVVDAKGLIRHQEIMLRAFRPTDRSVLASIYAARTDAIYERFKILSDSHRRKNNF